MLTTGDDLARCPGCNIPISVSQPLAGCFNCATDDTDTHTEQRPRQSILEPIYEGRAWPDEPQIQAYRNADTIVIVIRRPRACTDMASASSPYTAGTVGERGQQSGDEERQQRRWTRTRQRRDPDERRQRLRRARQRRRQEVAGDGQEQAEARTGGEVHERLGSTHGDDQQGNVPEQVLVE